MTSLNETATQCNDTERPLSSTDMVIRDLAYNEAALEDALIRMTLERDHFKQWWMVASDVAAALERALEALRRQQSALRDEYRQFRERVLGIPDRPSVAA